MVSHVSIDTDTRSSSMKIPLDTALDFAIAMPMSSGAGAAIPIPASITTTGNGAGALWAVWTVPIPIPIGEADIPGACAVVTWTVGFIPMAIPGACAVCTVTSWTAVLLPGRTSACPSVMVVANASLRTTGSMAAGDWYVTMAVYLSDVLLCF